MLRVTNYKLLRSEPAITGIKLGAGGEERATPK